MTIPKLRIGDVAEINPRPSRIPQLDEMVSFASMADLSAERGCITQSALRPFAEVCKGYTPFRAQDVLVAKITPCFENCKIGEASIPTDIGYGSTEFHVIRPLPARLDRRYLLHFLRQPIILKTGERRMTGSAGQRRVPASFLEALEIPLPPLEEQRRIAAILDKAAYLAIIQSRAEGLRLSMKHSLFEASFHLNGQAAVTIGTGLPPHVEGWEWRLLTDLAQLATGHTPDRSNPAYWGGDIPWITLGDIRVLDGKLACQTKELTTEAGIANSSAVLLPKGTVCFSRTASVGFATIMGRAMSTSQDFVNWVCGPDLLPEYLMHALIFSRARLRGLSTGSTHKTIYFSTVEQFMVLLPPISVQASFIELIRKGNSMPLAQSSQLHDCLKQSLAAELIPGAQK